MKNFVAAASLVSIFAAFAPAASAQTVVTFESLAGGPLQAFFGATHDGFNFGNNVLATNDWLYNAPPGVTYPSPAGSTLVAVGLDPSAPNFANQGNVDMLESSPVKLASGNDFYLLGAWFSGFSTDSLGAAALINFKLYNDNVLVGTSSAMTPSTLASAFLDTGALGLVAIDAFTVVGPAGYFLMDNVTYSMTPVPEVGTYAMMLVGLVGVGAMVRRKAKAA